MPVGWKTFGNNDYRVSLDSVSVKSGKYAACIEFEGEKTDFRAWSFSIPGSYTGKKVKLTGYIKTENVSAGYAGLWMRIDPGIAFDNMSKNGITGTTGWEKYEITLNADQTTPGQLVFGGLLTGKGKMWIDDLNITIDGRTIQKVKPFERKHYPAYDDHTFDEGSAITTLSLDTGQIAKLQTLGLVWGFLKYYHPVVATGKLNWDYELFRVLPAITRAKRKSECDSIYVQWIKRLGAFETGKESGTDRSAIKTEPDLDWISDSGFSDELAALLLKVKNAKRPRQHFYISLEKGVGNPDFENENPYKAMKYPDAGYRLLAVYRYWNIIQYYFPYRHLIEEDWKAVLAEFIPKVAGAENEEKYVLSLLELIVRIRDTHANLGGSTVLHYRYGKMFTAVRLGFIENKAVVTGYYDDTAGRETGLEIGDVITHINNRSVDDILRERLKYIPGSNYAAQLRDVAPSLLGTNDTILPVQFLRDNKTENRMLKTYDAKTFRGFNNPKTPDTCFKFVSPGIACINNGLMSRKDLPGIWKEAEHTKGLIIDIRNYPSDFLLYKLSEYLMPKATPFVKFTIGSTEMPGRFLFSPTLKAGKQTKSGYKGKVIILVNETTQSSAEFHAMAYRVHPNATVIGSTTAGADGNVSQLTLPGGLTTRISGIGVYYPDGKETQRIGIVPDIIITPTINGIKNGKDELMEKAIEIIQSQ